MNLFLSFRLQLGPCALYLTSFLPYFREIWRMLSHYMNKLLPLRKEKNIRKHYHCSSRNILVLFTW